MSSEAPKYRGIINVLRFEGQADRDVLNRVFVAIPLELDDESIRYDISAVGSQEWRRFLSAKIGGSREGQRQNKVE